jgi:large subunit ribosomal protein L22
MADKKINNSGHVAKASSKSLHVSPKHVMVICRHLRYKTTIQAKQILEDAINLKKAIPFRKFNKDMGHKKGMAAGRYVPKAASLVLKLVKSVEANASDIGLTGDNLKISKILANRAPRPATGGRNRGLPKRTHVEIEVIEAKDKPKKTNKSSQKVKEETTPKKVAPTSKVEEKKVEEKVTKDDPEIKESTETKVEKSQENPKEEVNEVKEAPKEGIKKEKEDKND